VEHKLAALVAWVFVARGFDNGAPSSDEAGPKQSLTGVVIKNKSVWFIAITTMLYLIAQQGVFAFWPRYLTEVRGVAAVTAGTWTSLASIIGIPVGIVVGIIADKMGSRKKPLIILSVACAVVYAFTPLYPTSSYIVMILLYGIATMGVMGLCFSSVAQAIDSPEQGSIAVSIVNMCHWIGIFVSSILFGGLLGAFGWNMAFYIMAPIAILSGLFALINKRVA